MRTRPCQSDVVVAEEDPDPPGCVEDLKRLDGDAGPDVVWCPLMCGRAQKGPSDKRVEISDFLRIDLPNLKCGDCLSFPEQREGAEIPTSSPRTCLFLSVPVGGFDPLS